MKKKPRELQGFNGSVTLCNRCGLPIKFAPNQKGRLAPVNPDGSEHWPLCEANRNYPKSRINSSSAGVIVGKDFVELPPLADGELPWKD